MNFVKSLKKDMTSFLGKKGRRVDLIIYSLTVVFVIFAPVYLFTCSAGIVDYLVALMFKGVKLEGIAQTVVLNIGNTVAGAVTVLAVIFVAFPILYSYFLASYRLYRDGAAGDIGYREAFKKRYMSTLAPGALMFGVLLICALPFIILVGVGSAFANHEDDRIAGLVAYLFFIIFALGLFLGFCVFLLFRSWFLFGYYSAKGKNLKESLSLSIKMMKTERAKALYKEYIKTFVPSLLLAIPTVTVLFFIDTLPKMILTYYRLADSLEYGE